MAVRADDAVKTYRYVRLTMVVLVLGLAASIVVERLKVHPGCFQHSISAYYYTPVRGMFVGGLVAVGACLIAVRGNSDVEDAILNLAGVLAPVVAFVPTPEPGSCTSTPGTYATRSQDAFNGISALFVLLAIAIVVAAVLLRGQAGPHPAEWLLLGLGVALWVAALLVFASSRAFFLRNAHYTAACTMFAAFFAVVVRNAFGFHASEKAHGRRARHPLTNRYAVIAGLMVAGGGGIAVWDWTVGWDHAVLFVEGTLITLFGTFWVLQTQELWNGGVREERLS
nr:hypothetical protein Hi04_10k_c2835_00004 [uncultured bacterium]